MEKKPLISLVINVRNEAENLDRCLKSVKGFANEIVIVDMHSTDNSLEIAKKYNSRVFSYRPMKYVEPARNYALSKAKGKWILLLDPDEVLTSTLKKELLTIIKREDVDFVKVPRKNLIFGKWIRHSKCWPDYLIRFFKKNSVTWKNEIHSQPECKGNSLTLIDVESMAIKHYNYRSVSQYLTRAIRYSSVQADELFESGYRPKITDFLLKPIQEFNSRYFYAEGYKDGIHGLIFCLLQSFSICLIYIRLWEKNGSEDKTVSKESFVSAVQESLFEFGHWFSLYFKNEYSKNIFKNLLIKIRQILNRLTKNF